MRVCIMIYSYFPGETSLFLKTFNNLPGTIHLGNLLTNTRVILKYIVEERSERRAELEKLVGTQSGIQIVGVDKTDVVVKDKR